MIKGANIMHMYLISSVPIKDFEYYFILLMFFSHKSDAVAQSKKNFKNTFVFEKWAFKKKSM